MARVAPSERFPSELDDVLAGIGEDRDPVETIGRLGARLILQQALEDEVSEFLGRGRYEHRGARQPSQRLRAADGQDDVGPVELERPRIRNAGELGFESRVLGNGVARTHALESLVICSFLRGLSTRDPSAMAVVERDLDALVAHLRLPSEHRKRVRTTNLLERTFVEVRRRTKVIGRFPGETSALSLIWAGLELSSRSWRGVVMAPETVTIPRRSGSFHGVTTGHCTVRSASIPFFPDGL